MVQLTVKQQSFIDNYIKTLNGTEAARRAKYQGDDNTLGVIAHENLRKPKIRAEINRRLEELQITDSEILHRLGQQAVGDIGDALHIDGNYVRLDIEKLHEMGLTHLIKKFKQSKSGTEIEFYDGQAAAVHLFKLRRLLQDQPTVIVKLKQALESGQITPDELSKKYPTVAAEFFANVDH